MILQYAYGYDDTVAKFVADLIPTVRDLGFGKCATIGIVEGNMLIAGLVYHNWDPRAATIEISGAAIPGHYWMTRETIKRMYQYPFLGCRCQMVINRVPAEDERQLAMLARYGYSFIRIPRGLGRGKDLVLCLLTIEDWANNNFNKRLHHHIDVAADQEAA